MTIVESLNSYNNYPIPVARREMICIECGLISGKELDYDTTLSREYKRAKAMVFNYLASAPNISENGITYSFTETDKKRFLDISRGFLEEIGEADGEGYGYKGEDL